MQVKKQEIEQGEKIKQVADRVWGWNTQAGTLRAKRRVKEFLRYFDLRENKRILEVGCGTGIFTEFFCQIQVKPIAVDISYDLLQEAMERNPNIIFIQADAENLPFKVNVFDCVFGVSILHHLDISAALRSIKAVLKNNGVIIFSEPNMLNPQIFLQKRIPLLKRFMLDTPAETAFFRWRLKKILELNGFKQINIHPFEFLHPFIPKCLINFVKKLELHLEGTPFIREIAGSLLIFAEK